MGCYIIASFLERSRMTQARFSHDLVALKTIAADALAHAARKGATGCEAEASDGYGQTVTVRKGEVETIEYNRDKGLGVTVYVGKRKGYASTADLGARAIRDTVEAALTIARFTAEDDAAGLADPEDLARDPGDLDLFHPWNPTVEEAIAIAKACEGAAFRLDKRVVNSEGASVSCQQWQFALGNSHGFMEGFPTSRHTLSCAVIAAENGQMQRDDWYSSQRSVRDLPGPEAVGDYAGRRALGGLRSRKIGTMQAPVLCEAPVASDLISTFVSAVSGGNLYRKASFLLDALGKTVFSPNVTLIERPHLARGQASSWYDDEGVATRDRDVVKDGVLRGYFLGSYSARKLGMKTTGSAGGNHNLILRGGDRDFAGLIRKMGRGLLVTELIGFGVNLVTGDYSRGAAGYWVEGGEIRHPVEEITVAGNLRDMFRSIAAIGSDALTRGSRTTGSILIDGMTIAGN